MKKKQKNINIKIKRIYKKVGHFWTLCDDKQISVLKQFIKMNHLKELNLKNESNFLYSSHFFTTEIKSRHSEKNISVK